MKMKFESFLLTKNHVTAMIEAMRKAGLHLEIDWQAGTVAVLTMKVKPKEDYKLLGTSITLDSSKVYDADHATNIKDWKEKGLIFVNEFLLESGEYEIVKN